MISAYAASLPREYWPLIISPGILEPDHSDPRYLYYSSIAEIDD